MDYAALVAKVQAQFEDDGTEFVASIPTFITHAENTIFKQVSNLPLFRTTSTGSMVTGTATITRPNGARMIRQLSYTTAALAEVFLERRLDSFLKDYWPTVSSTGTPLFYAEDDEGTVRIAPTPDSTYAYTVYIVRLPTGMSSTNTTTELGDHYENVLTYGTFAEAVKFLENETLIPVWDKTFQDELARLRQEVGRVYSNEYGAGA